MLLQELTSCCKLPHVIQKLPGREKKARCWIKGSKSASNPLGALQSGQAQALAAESVGNSGGKTGTPQPGSPMALACLNDAVNEHVLAV